MSKSNDESGFENVRQVDRPKKLSCFSLKAKNKGVGWYNLINFTTNDLWLKQVVMMVSASLKKKKKKLAEMKGTSIINSDFFHL